MQLVCFHLGQQELAVPIEAVRETIDLRPITKVFHTPACVVGILNLRGEILAVLDPALLVGLPRTVVRDTTRVVIVESGARSAGLVVDALGALREVAPDDIARAPSTVSAEIASLLAGVLALPERPVAVLDVAKLLDAPVLAPHLERSEGGPTAEAHG